MQHPLCPHVRTSLDQAPRHHSTGEESDVPWLMSQPPQGETRTVPEKQSATGGAAATSSVWLLLVSWPVLGLEPSTTPKRG